MSCGPTYGQFVAWLHAAGLLPSGLDSIAATSGTGNVAGAAISAGKLVYVSGWDNVNNCQMVALADPSDLLTCATYIATTTVPAGLVAGSTGTVSKQGTITGLALVAAIGDNARLAAAGGGNVQAGTTGLLASNICQQEVGHFVTAGTSVYVDLSAAPIHRIGTSELQGNCVTAAKADLTANWAWTAASPQITLGDNTVAAGLTLRDGSSAFAGTITQATLAAARTLTVPDPGGNATFIMSQGTTNAVFAGASPQITLGIGGVTGGLALRESSTSNLGTLRATALTGARAYTFPDATGNVPVTAKVVAAPVIGTAVSNTNPANIRFGNVRMASGTSTCTVTVTGAPDTNSASGSTAYVTLTTNAGAFQPVGPPTNYVIFKAAISGGTLTITLLNANTGAATNASSDLTFSYVVMY